MTVPLDRANPDAGTIDIYFAFVPRADTGQPAAGTILGLTGGPGPSTLESGPGVWADWAAAAGPYDLLLTDYRGTGRSAALRYCGGAGQPVPERDRRRREALSKPVLRRSRTRSRTSTPWRTADDLEAVRTALGLGPLDLLGLSHGTYVAQVYASRHPESVRSAVLDGAVPLAESTEANWFGRYSIPNLRAAVAALETICARSSGACWPTR